MKPYICKFPLILFFTLYLPAGSAFGQEQHDHDHDHDHNEEAHKDVEKKSAPNPKQKISEQASATKTEHPDEPKVKKNDEHEDHDDDHKDHAEHKDGEKVEHTEHGAEEKGGHSDHEGHEEEGHSDHKGEGHDEHEGGGHDDHGASAFGKDKAITRVEHDGERFELNEKAEKLLKIITTEIKAQGKKFVIPKSALVTFRDEYGVYVKRGKAYQLLETKKIVKSEKQVSIELDDAGPSEFVVTQGVGLLRVAHLQASGQGGEGHVH